MDSLFSSAFEDTLRTHFHILDVNKVASLDDQEARQFAIGIERRTKDSRLNYLLMAINVASFAIIPCVVNEREQITFTVRSPWGAENTFQYSYTERYYSWLPFMLFSPGFTANPRTTHDDYKEERLKIFEDITSRFMIEAAPFITDQYHQHIGAGTN